jgi:peptidoglycan/LPS O-acetylase OafA/YrhL
MRKNMKASDLSLRSAVLVAILGMAWGIAMAASHDHSTMPAHAHVNLLGWVSLFLFGIFYRLHPTIDRSRAAVLQVYAWIIGTLAMAGGLALLFSGHEFGEPIAAVASLWMLVSMAVFSWLVFRGQSQRQSSQVSLQGAE